MGLRTKCVAIFAVCLLTSASACGEGAEGSFLDDNQIIVAMGDDLPGLSRGSHQPSGMEIKLKEWIEGSLEARLARTPIKVADREAVLLGDNPLADIVIYAYSITDARNERGIDFAGPYMKTKQAMMVRAKEKGDFTGISSMKGKAVCSPDGSTMKSVPIPGATKTYMSTDEECVTALLEGDVDAVFSDTLILYGRAQAHKDKLAVVLPNNFGSDQYYGIGLKGGQPEACRKLNEVIQDYLETRWRDDFQQMFPSVVAEFRADDPEGDFESKFKPIRSDMDRLSCQLSG